MQSDNVRLYTPYYSVADGDADRNTYCKPIGEGRINLVIVQDKLICVRRGCVLLPGIGVVVSLEESMGEEFLRTTGLQYLEDGYYDSNVELTIELEGPSEIDAEDWQQMEWAYGGGLSLILDGESVCDKADMSKWFAEEGWMSPLSRQTQESSIHTMVKHPRTAIGVTWTGELVVLVFSGRTAIETVLKELPFAKETIMLEEYPVYDVASEYKVHPNLFALEVLSKDTATLSTFSNAVLRYVNEKSSFAIINERRLSVMRSELETFRKEAEVLDSLRYIQYFTNDANQVILGTSGETFSIKDKNQWIQNDLMGLKSLVIKLEQTLSNDTLAVEPITTLSISDIYENHPIKTAPLYCVLLFIFTYVLLIFCEYKNEIKDWVKK